MIVNCASRITGVNAMNQLAAPLQGLRILVVEDDALIALDCQQSLQDAGAIQVEIAKSMSEVSLLLSHTSFDIAVIDIFLGAETGIPIAELMVNAGAAFVFCSGATIEIELPSALKGAVTIQKPYSTSGLINVIRASAIQAGRFPQADPTA
jgi:DNA-binding NtrC family response regulator